MKKVSVVVPIYRVEPYLKQCVHSILAQTYQNLEIILVDDGSPDRCPEICDMFAGLDQRVKVIHKKNGGVSDARNRGIERACGDYLMFVDGDDWIEHTMVERLVSACEKYGVSLASCARYVMDENSSKQIAFTSREKVYSAEEALNEILAGKAIDVAVWDKLYTKELFDAIRFPVGENNEDIAIFYQIIDKAGKIAHCGTAEYYYRDRPGSLTKLRYHSETRKVIEKDLKELGIFIDKKYPGCRPAFDRYKAVNIYLLFNKYIKWMGADGSPEYAYLMQSFQKDKKHFFKDNRTPKKEKLIAGMMLLRIYGPYLAVKEKVIGYR